MNISNSALILSILLTTASAPLTAAEHPSLFGPIIQYFSDEIDADTSADLEVLEVAAKSGQWRTLSQRAERLGARLAKQGHRDSRVFGVIAGYRAVAAAALNDEIGARWDWQVALNLLEGVPTADFEGVWAAAPFLAEVTIPGFHQRIEGNVQRREIQKAERPNFLLGASDKRRAPLAFTVQIVGGGDGLPYHPRVLLPEAGALRENGDRVYSGLEAMRRFRFSPAREDGQPAQTPFRINLSYGFPDKPSGRRRAL